MTPKSVTFDIFRNQWLDEIVASADTPCKSRQLFAKKIFSQWLDLGESQENWIVSDELSELGIDLIYYDAGEDGDNAVFGNIWYIVKSCFEGVLHPHRKSIFEDGKQILEILDSRPDDLPSSFRELIDKIQTFVLKTLDNFTNDRFVLVFATEKPLTSSQTASLEKLLEFGRSKIGVLFDVEAISIKTIYLNVLQEDMYGDGRRLEVPISVNVSRSASNLLVGTIKLADLYWFLRSYRLQTGNLDQLFEKNVRRFLGTGGAINKAMQTTLLEDPAQFGLYNNGITFVVEDFRPEATDHFTLVEPYIVNGCQTTRTIWEVFRQKYEMGRYGLTPGLLEWRKVIDEGVVVIKIVRVGDAGEKLLHNITRYTNSQNAVKEEDFLTLEEGFHILKTQMGEKYGIFLEVQRGGWDSQLALQKSNSNVEQFFTHANAFELLKVYSAGWLGEAGVAFSANKPFLPGGSIYRKIIQDRQPPFGVDDLYAAYLLKLAGFKNDFGRGAKKASRRQTRYLFYMVTIELLRDVLIRGELPTNPSNLTTSILKINRYYEAWNSLIASSVEAVDEYLTKGEDESIFNEPMFFKMFNGNLNAYLSWDYLGVPEKNPRYAAMMGLNKRIMGRGQPSPRDVIISALKSQ